MTDTFRHFLDASSSRISRRNFLVASAAISGGMAIGPTLGSRRASAAALKEVRFSEAVHNLGYINLYVGMHAEHLREERPRYESERRRWRHSNICCCARRIRGFRDRRCDDGADFARERWPRCCGRHGRATSALFRRIKNAEADHRSERLQGSEDRHFARAEYELQCCQANVGEGRPQGRRGCDDRSR